VAAAPSRDKPDRRNALLVVTRFRVPETAQADFGVRARAALAALAERPGWQRGRLARAADDAELWMLETEWESVGAWRRALGGLDVKLHATPLLAQSIDEPTAYEVLYDATGASVVERSSDRAPDAGTVSVGEAAGPGDAWASEHP
jgi:hypothetical protein